MNADYYRKICKSYPEITVCVENMFDFKPDMLFLPGGQPGPTHLMECKPLCDALVEADTLLDAAQKARYRELAAVADPDEREKRMRGESWYRHVLDDHYPRLRTVRFAFALHRKGMVKDTVHTTELDTAYMRGVQLIRDREYEKALGILKDYRDYNTAVAYLSMDYNA